jgi:CheY-like chemotaxis protein
MTTPAPTERSRPPVALLVDRDLDTVAMYAEYLSQASYAIEYATDGRDALVKAIARPPDILVTDTRLPGIDGYQLMELIRRDPQTQAVWIVTVTADADPVSLERARTAGADAVLVKPCLPDELLSRLQQLIARSRKLQSRSAALRTKVGRQLGRARAIRHRRAMSHVFDRRTTTTPLITPPKPACPDCRYPLVYRCSHLGGVSARHPEQWDDFECENGCGAFHYRHRTGKLRRV